MEEGGHVLQGLLGLILSYFRVCFMFVSVISLSKLGLIGLQGIRIETCRMLGTPVTGEVGRLTMTVVSAGHVAFRGETQRHMLNSRSSVF